MAKTAKRGRPRGKQIMIPGTEPGGIAELDGAADTYYDAMMERTRLSKEEHEAKDALIDKMKENGLTVYETTDGLVVRVVDHSNVKCKRKNAEENGDGDE